MLRGINHITLAVSDLDKSFNFYVSVMGMKPHVRWSAGAYLTVGSLWFCISLDQAAPSGDYSHIAFDVSDAEFDCYCSRLRNADVRMWKDNGSEGKSLYILDPDGHKLEVHAGDLASRLAELRSSPYEGLEWC